MVVIEMKFIIVISIVEDMICMEFLNEMGVDLYGKFRFAFPGN